MLGLILRLIAAGEGNRGAGGSVKNLTRKYLVLGIAGIIFATAIAFATLAAFWALEARIQDPIMAAAIMVGILILVALLTALIAYGLTKEEETPSPSKVIARELCPSRPKKSAARLSMPPINMARSGSRPRLPQGACHGVPRQTVRANLSPQTSQHRRACNWPCFVTCPGMVARFRVRSSP